jgi:hypothetical protein
MSWSSGMGSSPTRQASCPSRWLNLVCKIPISLLGLSETNTVGYYTCPLITAGVWARFPYPLAPHHVLHVAQASVSRFSFFSRSRSKNALRPARPLGSDNGDTGPGAHRVPGCSGAFRTSGRRHDNSNHRSAYTPPWLQHSFLPNAVAGPVRVCRRQQVCQSNKAISRPEVGHGPAAQRVWYSIREECPTSMKPAAIPMRSRLLQWPGRHAWRSLVEDV